MATRNVLNFDRPVTIQTPVTTRGSYGDEATTWTDVATIRASVKWPQTKSDEAYSADTLVVTKRAVFTTRYRDDITEKCRLVFNGEYYDILNVTEGEKRRQYLVITTEKRSTDNA